MTFFNSLAVLAAETSESAAAAENTGTMDKLKEIFKNPVLYIVLGSLVLLILLVYFLRRFVKARPNAATIIVRRGKVYKILDEKNPKCFMVPFVDHIGAVISNDEKEFSSDKLFINNGPDALYKINYTLKYRVIDPAKFYPFIDKLNNELPVRLNDELRLFADQGNALMLVNDYRDHTSEILEVINKAVSDYQIEIFSFKFNIIEPMGRK